MREALWLWALSLRRWRRMIERLVSDAAVRKRVLTGSLGATAGFVPLLWVVFAGGIGAGRGIDYAEADAFALAVAAMWLLLVQPALSGQAIVLPRAGLTLALGGPIAGRGLIAWWASRAWVGLLLLHGLLLGWVASRIVPGLFTTPRLLAMGVAVVLAAAAAMGLVGTVASVHHRLARPSRLLLRIVGGAIMLWCCVIGAHVVFHGERSTILPHPYERWWLAAVDGTLEVVGTLLSPVSPAFTSPALGVPHLVLGGVACTGLAICWRAAPLLDVTAVLESSIARAEALQEAKRRRPKARRAARLTRFGSGTAALVWKSMAEAEARHSRVGLVVSWLILAAIGVALGYGMYLVANHDKREAVAGIAMMGMGVAAAVSGMVGGSAGMGLATEIRHPSWLVRYPLPPAGILAATVGLPAALGAVVLFAFALPALLVAGPHRPLLAVGLAAALAVTLAARGLRTLIWLRFPPGPGSNTLTEALQAAAFAFPMGITIALGLLMVVNGWLPPVAAVAVAGSPCVVIAGLCWPASVRLLRRLEMQ